MSDLLEKLFDSIVKGVASEGSRVLRDQATRAAEQAVDGVRRLLFIQYLMMTACFTWAASFLLTGYLVVTHWDAVKALEFPPELIFSLAVLVSAKTLLWVTCRRWLWMRALGLAKRSKKPRAPSALSEEVMAALVERSVKSQLGTVVGEQIREAMREQGSARGAATDRDEERQGPCPPPGERVS